MFRSMAGKGEAEAHSIDHWVAVGQKLTAEKHLAEDVKKVLVTRINESLRRLLDDISEDNWMYDPTDLDSTRGHDSISVGNPTMTTPVYVLKPIASGYKEVLLPPGTRYIGRSAATGIKSQVVSRKHVEVAVERGKCKVRYCAKFVSEVKINNSPVNKEWVEFPVGARMDLLANVAEAFPYRLERYATTGSSAAAFAEAGGSGNSANYCDQHREMTTRLNCSICSDLYVDPTELDCKGRHLFCHSCIHDFLTSETCNNKCPVCTTDISYKRRSEILHAGRKREASGVPVGKYQSQAVGLVQDMIEWLIDKRMVDYDDESEWRKRSGLEPLPPPPKGSGASDSKPAGVFGGSTGVRSPPPPRGIFSAGGGGGAADVINLLSDSMEDDDDDDDDDDSFSEDEDF
eukprot:g8916.t1